MSIAGPPPASPADVGRALLDAVIAYYAAHETDELNPTSELPPSRYLAPGAWREVTWDHDDGQLTVALDRTVLGIPLNVAPVPSRSPQSRPGNVGRITQNVSLVVQLVRCQPSLTYSGRDVSHGVLDGQGHQLLADSGHLLRAVVQAVADGVLLRDGVHAEVLVGDLTSSGPLGDLASIEVPVTVPLI